MAEPAPAFTLDDRGRIRLGDDVFVYLERMLAPPGPLPADVAPRGYGLAPAVAAADSVVAPVGPGEAVWLGFQPLDATRPALVRVRVDLPEPLDAVTGGQWDDERSDDSRNYLTCPPDSRLTGIRRGSGYVPFGLGRLTVLSYGDAPALVPIELMPPDEFTRLTGRTPEPLDPASAYKGWRLP